MSENYEDIEYYIQRSKDIELTMHPWTEEDEQHLQQIKEWCKASHSLWEVIARIGWEINEG